MRGMGGRVAVLVAMAFAGLSCGREITGPAGSGVRGSASFALEPQLPAALVGPTGATLVAYESVRLVFRRAGGSVALDRTYAFPSTADSLALNVQVPFGPDATDEGEAFTVLLKFLTTSGSVVFAGGPASVFARGAAGGTAQPLVIPVTYVGPGASATRIVIGGQAAIRLTGTQGVSLTTQAFDGQNQLVSDAPVAFTSTDTSIVQVNAAGVVTGRNARGSALVIARLLSGPADTVSVTTQPNPATIAAIGGNAQTGPAGAALPTPIAVKVTAADGLGVSGVSVAFAAGSDGSVSNASVLTNSTGDASVTWTLGPVGGAQTLTATAVGLTGSPLAFTATATTAAATQLAFTVQPVATTAGANFAPALQVTARTATGATATGYSGPITIALGSNPANGVLAGSTTAIAVGGVATFGAASIAKAGNYTLVATASGLASASSVGFTILPGAPVTLAWAQQPLSGSAGAPLSPALRVRTVDSFGNFATNGAGVVALAFAANPTGALLQGTTSAQLVEGEATFSNVAVSLPGSGYRLQASASGLIAATSDLFNIGGGAVIGWINASGGLWSNPANWSLSRVPVAGDTVRIDAAGTYLVTMDANPSVARLDLGGGSGTQTLALSSRTLTASGGVTIGANGVLRVEGSSIGGGGTIQNGGTMDLLLSSTIALPITNGGTITASGFATLNGALTTTAGSLLRVAQADALAGTASLTVATGFTNNGSIELSNATSSATGAQLLVTTGTLVNAAGASISALNGQSGGGARTLAAPLDNRGTVTVGTALTLSRSSADHLNSGTITATAANFSITQTGTTPTFTNTGTMTIGSGRTLAVSAGGFVQAGILEGGGTVTLTGTTLTLTRGWSTANARLRAASSVINGPDTLTNAAAQTLELLSSTVNAPLVNAGTLVASGNSNFNGAVTTAVGSLLRVAQLDACCGTALLTVANGFTNRGTLELSNGAAANYAAQLTMSAGTLVNAPGATITATAGQTAGGARTLAVELDNQGTVTPEVPLTLARGSSAAHRNSGTINVTTANLTISQTFATSSFTNTGSIAVAAGRTLALSTGTFSQQGTLAGGGTLALSFATLELAQPLATADIVLSLTSATVNGPSLLTNSEGRTLTMLGGTINAKLLNQGIVVASGNVFVTDTLTTSVGSVLRVAQLDNCCAGVAKLIFTYGFTNRGTIELSNGMPANYSSQLGVNLGPLVNATGGLITAVAGSQAGGTREITAQLDNQGSIAPAVPMSILMGANGGVNTGTIDLSQADLTTTAAQGIFANRGTITIGAGRALRHASGTFSQEGTVTGPGTLAVSSGTLQLQVGFSTAQTALTVTNGNVGGPDTLTNAAGRTLTLVNGTINAPLVNNGTVVASGNSFLNGAVVTAVGSILRVAQVDAALTTATLDVVNGFTNLGTIELSSAFTTAAGARLIVRNAPLVNAFGGSITAVGGQTPGGTRTLTAVVDNQGTILANVPLTVNRPTAVASNVAFVNAGTMHAAGGNITITQASTANPFTHTGAIQIDSGRTFGITSGTFTSDIESSVSGGTFTIASATASLNGILEVAEVIITSSVITISDVNTTGGTKVRLTSSTVNGTGAFDISAGDSVVFNGATVNIPVTNAGVLTVGGLSSITGALTQVSGAKIRVGQLSSESGVARLTVANGFTNLGIIELTNLLNIGGFAAELAVTSGTLVNGAGATIVSLPGVLGGGARVIAGSVNNQGLLSVVPGGAGNLTITQSLSSTGTIALELGGTTVSTGFDRLEILGTATLGGALNVGLFGGFTPASGNSFAVLSATGGVSGTFASTVLPAGIAPAPTYGATLVTLVAP